MYILYKLERRAETTDTILYYAASEREILEEVLLSLYDEIYEYEVKCHMNDPDPMDEKSLQNWAINRLSNFSIIYIPYIY